MKKPHYERMPIGKPFGSYTLHLLRNKTKWRQGHFISHHHTVLVYAQEDFISLSIWTKGIGYFKTIKFKSLPSDLSLSRQASKFSKEVHLDAEIKEFNEGLENKDLRNNPD